MSRCGEHAFLSACLGTWPVWGGGRLGRRHVWGGGRPADAAFAERLAGQGAAFSTPVAENRLQSDSWQQMWVTIGYFLARKVSDSDLSLGPPDTDVWGVPRFGGVPRCKVSGQCLWAGWCLWAGCCLRAGWCLCEVEGACGGWAVPGQGSAPGLRPWCPSVGATLAVTSPLVVDRA